MPATDRTPKYKRILLKLSGEALMGDFDFGIDPNVLDRMALEIGQLRGIGVQVGLVVGGGNLFRGAALIRKRIIMTMMITLDICKDRKGKRALRS